MAKSACIVKCLANQHNTQEKTMDWINKIDIQTVLMFLALVAVCVAYVIISSDIDHRR